MAAKIRMALIATYPKLAEIYLNLTDSRDDIIAYNVYASFEEAAKTARDMEDGLDIILSRGATAEYIRRAVHIPVLPIPITPFDVIKVIHSMNPVPDSIALIHYSKNVRDVQEIAKIFGIRIEEYTFLNRSDIRNAIADASGKGIRTIVGGHVAVEIATKNGLNAVELSAGEEAMDRSIEEAIALLYQIRAEQEHNTRIRSALNALVEGIVVTDDKKRIITINKAASRMFQKNYRKGETAGPEILTAECLSVYKTGREHPFYIKKIRRETYSVTHIPVIRGETFLGVVSRFEDITKTEALEQKIRKEIQAKGFDAEYSFTDIITQAPVMETVKRQAEIFAQTDSTILIEGESGTGKELFAQSIHNGSTRKNRPFVAVNCAAIPASLLESELFGYEKGAFTGAQKEGKAGFFELAHLGTLFLDEIGEVTMEVQTRLLRVLQEHEIMRVGGDRIIPVDVRVVAATNRDLEEEIRQGRFRRDLYYRLNILQLKIPPLRERTGDVGLMAVRFAAAHGVSEEEIRNITPLLSSYSWPGNVRELRNIVERYCVLCPFLASGRLSEDNLIDALGLGRDEEEDYAASAGMGDASPPPSSVPYAASPDAGEEDQDFTFRLPRGASLADIVGHVEYVVSRKYLAEFGNDQEKAADALGIGRTTLWRKSRTDPLA